MDSLEERFQVDTALLGTERELETKRYLNV